MANLNAKTDARATAVDTADVLVFGDVSADGWDTITFANLVSSLSLVDSDLASFDPATQACVAFLDADQIAGSDGDAVSTWSVSGSSTGGNFTQGTSGNRPVLKKSSNGINGRNVVRFDGSNDYLQAATGGASLAGNWYVAVVAKHSSLASYQCYFAWGDNTARELRSLFKYDTSNYFSFIGESADFQSSTAVSNATAYFLECQYDSASGTLTLWVDGTRVASGAPSATFLSYAATTLTVGAEPNGTFPLAGDVAAVFVLGSLPGDTLRAQLASWVYSRYGIAVAGTGATGGHVPLYTSITSIGASAIFQTQGGAVVLGDDTPLNTRNTALTATTPALLSVLGGFAAHTAGAEHQLSNSFNAESTLALWNQHAGGFSSLRFRRNDTTGAEMGVLAYGRTEPWGDATQGCLFIETSDFNGGSAFTEFRIVQTQGSAGGIISRRVRVQANGDIVFNDQAHYTGQAAYLTIKANGDIVPGSAALATNATAGFLFLPTCAGTPTGTPTTYTGRAAAVYDTTNNKIYVYNGAWKATGALT